MSRLKSRLRSRSRLKLRLKLGKVEVLFLRWFRISINETKRIQTIRRINGTKQTEENKD